MLAKIRSVRPASCVCLLHVAIEVYDVRSAPHEQNDLSHDAANADQNAAPSGRLDA
jgi:hypothetical protein